VSDETNFDLAAPAGEQLGSAQSVGSATDATRSSFVNMIRYLENLDNRSANELSPKTTAESVASVQNGDVAGMESMDIVRRGNYIYAMQKEPGKEAVLIPLTPNKALTILASRNQIRRDASDRLRLKEEEMEAKTKLVKGLRASGYGGEELAGLVDALMGMDLANARAMVRDLLKAKYTDKKGSKGSSSAGEIVSAHQQKMAYLGAKEQRGLFSQSPRLRELQSIVEELSQDGRVKLAGNNAVKQRYEDAVAELEAMQADVLNRERMMAVVGMHSVPNTDEMHDPRSYVQVAFSNAVGNPSAGVSTAMTARSNILPLIDATRILGLMPGQGATNDQVLVALNDASMRLTGRMFIASPEETAMLGRVLEGQPGYNIFTVEPTPEGTAPPPTGSASQPQDPTTQTQTALGNLSN
jgi:hypothetical protein